MINAGAVNSLAVNAAAEESPPLAVGDIDLPLTLVVALALGDIDLPLVLTVYHQGDIDLPITLVVGELTGDIDLPIRTVVYAAGDIDLPLTLVVVEDRLGRAPRWRPVVRLAGVDISAQLTGEIVVEAEEGAARIADVLLRPPAGVVSPLAYVGAGVQVDFSASDAAGAALYPVRVFTGIVDVPEYDPSTRLIALRCTDDRQGVLAATPAPTLDALIGGNWSSAALGEPENNWDYAEKRASTVPASLDLSAQRAPRLTVWEAKATPDHVLDGDNDLVEGLLRFRLANRTQIKNRVDIDASYRFARLKNRVVRARWQWNDDDRTGIWAVWPWTGIRIQPTREIIAAAAADSGWEVLSASYTDAEPVIAGAGAATRPLAAASLRLRKRYGQTITEQYAVTVRAAESIAALGEIRESRAVSIETEFDIVAWEADAAAAPVLADPPIWGEVAADQAAGAEGRAAADAMIEAAVAAAQAAILASHRLNGAEFRLQCSPLLDLTQTVQASGLGVSAIGKVRKFTHRMSIDTGEASTDVDLALSGSYATGIQPPTSTPTAPTPPAPPSATAETIAGWNDLYASHFAAEFSVGQFAGMPPPNDAWTGWVVTVSTLSSGTTPPRGDLIVAGFTIPGASGLEIQLAYDTEFRVAVPGVDSAERDPTIPTAAAVFDVRIPDDALTMST